MVPSEGGIEPRPQESQGPPGPPLARSDAGGPTGLEPVRPRELPEAEPIPEAVPFPRAPQPKPSSDAVRKAWILALVADGLQIVLFPMFEPGIVSPASDVLDVLVAVLMFRLLGWHPSFLPTLIAELVPGLDLFPTWTTAVWFATRKRVGNR